MVSDFRKLDFRPDRLVVAAVLLLGLVLAVVPVAGVATAAEAGGKLIVTGRAEVKAEPDMAIFSVGVDTRRSTLEEARQENAKAMEGVRQSLLDAGINERDMQTRGFNVHPEWSYDNKEGTRTLIGYRVVHTLEVTVSDLDQLGALMDAAIGQGANQISGPTFGLKNPGKLEAAALTEAVRRARDKAEVLARAGGVYIKGISEISEQVSLPVGGAVRASFMAMDAMESAPTSISPGEISATATVVITFEI